MQNIIDELKAWNGPLDNLPVYEPGLSDVVTIVGNHLFNIYY